MKKSFCLIIVAFCSLAACKPLSPAGRGGSEKPLPSRIAFVTFEARKMPDQTCQIELIDYHSAEGKIKEGLLTDPVYPVQVTLMDSGQKPVTRFNIEHPLFEDFEYADDNGVLSHKVRVLDSARFHLRFNQLPSYGFIGFESDPSVLPGIKSLIKIKL